MLLLGLSSIQRTIASFVCVFLLFFLVGGSVTVFSKNSCVVFASPDGVVTKPSVPEFTVNFVDNSYTVPPVHGTDSYTGEPIVSQEGYYIQSKTIEVVIMNQPFTPSNAASDEPLLLCYSVRLKGHFTDSWRYPDYSSYVQFDDNENRVNFRGADPNSEYSTITYGLVGNNGTHNYYKLDASEGGQIDFQVQAFIGYRTRVNDTFVPGVPSSNPTDPIPYHYVFTGETSEWSQIQTLTIPVTDEPVITDETPSPDEVLNRTDPLTVDLDKITFAIAVVALAVSLLGYFKKNKN